MASAYLLQVRSARGTLLRSTHIELNELFARLNLESVYPELVIVCVSCSQNRLVIRLLRCCEAFGAPASCLESAPLPARQHLGVRCLSTTGDVDTIMKEQVNSIDTTGNRVRGHRSLTDLFNVTPVVNGRVPRCGVTGRSAHSPPVTLPSHLVN